MKCLVILAFALAFVHGNSSPEIVPIPGGIAGEGITTRYWDCCKPSCAWTYKTNLVKAVQTCEIDGVTPISDQAQSGCAEDGSGTAYTCNSNQPFVVNSTLSYGFVAASFTGGYDVSYCCECVLLNFHGALKGKSLLGLITNTGDALAVNHFDIEIPGGGVGIFPHGCAAQWGADPEHGWGDQYGGIHSQEECAELPKVFSDGCNWRWNFMEGVSNPNVTFYQVQCPRELLDIAQCQHE